MRDPRTLSDARLQSHWAAQVAATPGRTLSPSRADDSHTSFRWIGGALVQDDAIRSGLRIRDLTLLLGDDALPLDGRTIDDAFAWLAARLPNVRKEFNEPMPPMPERFSLRDREAFEELDRYYAMTVPLLRAIHDDVRCWPHHFDIATLLEFDGGARTIGAGLSPGDASCGEPYWYVSDSPLETPPLSGGAEWVREGWSGAMLRASSGGDALMFFREAIRR